MEKKPITYSDDFKEIRAQWDECKDWEQDPHGYFLIKLDRKSKEIVVGFSKGDNTISKKITGRIPQEIYYTLIREDLVSSLQHAAYLGKELHKAYVAIQLGIEYTQDSPLDFSKKI